MIRLAGAESFQKNSFDLFQGDIWGRIRYLVGSRDVLSVRPTVPIS